MNFPAPEPRTGSIYVPGQQQFGHPSTWPAGPPAPPTPPKYRASAKSRIVVWTFAALLLGTLAAVIGYPIYGAVKDIAREDKVIGACRQEARRHIQEGAAEAEFRRERVTNLDKVQSEAFGVMYFRGTQQRYVCRTHLDGGRWTIQEFRFGN